MPNVRRFRLAIVLLSASVPGAPALGGAPLSAQQSTPSVSAARVAAQVGVGTLATPVAFIAGGLGSRSVARALGADEESARKVAFVGAYTGVWLATAAIPAAIAGDGRFPAALAGSALGMAAAAGTVRLGNRTYDSQSDGEKKRCGVLCWSMGALIAAFPSIGATIAYNHSRP